MFRVLVLLVAVFISSFGEAAIEVAGRVRFAHDYSGRRLATLITTNEYFDEHRVSEIFLGETKPVMRDGFGFWGYFELNGVRAYSNDFIRVSGDSFKKDGHLTILNNPKIVEIMFENPRIECHSIDDKTWLYYLHFGYPSMEPEADPGAFMRIDTCGKNSDIACGYTFATSQVAVPKGPLRPDHPVNFKTSRDGSGQFQSRAWEDFKKKYGEERYLAAYFSEERNERFELNLTSELTLNQLKLRSAGGVFDIRKVAEENKSLGMKPNVTVSWKWSVKDMFLDGKFDLYCYRWN